MSLSRIRGLVVTALFVTSCLALFSGASAQTRPSYELTGLKIVNYNQYGHIFNDVSDGKDYEYWNALGTSIIVSAVISGPKDTYIPGRRVQFKAYDGKKLIQTHIGSVGYIRTGIYHVPIMLYGPLCRPLKIEARMLGQKDTSPVSQTLNIACRE